MQQTKPPLWARIVGMIVAGALDNLWLLIAAGWLIYGDMLMGIVSILMAFYVRLTEIRDRVAQPEFTLTLNQAQPTQITQQITQGEKA